MTYYSTEYGGQFNTYDEAVEACLCDQKMDVFGEYFSYQISYTKLLDWAMKQDQFYNDFCNEIDQANQEYLSDFITEHDDDDES